MFFNKKTAAPKGDQLVPDKGYGLFVDRVKLTVAAAKEGGASRMPIRNREPSEVIDVVDMRDMPMRARQEFETTAEASALRPAVEAINSPVSDPFPGLKITKREPSADAISATVSEGATPPPRGVTSEKDGAKKSIFSGLSARLGKGASNDARPATAAVNEGKDDSRKTTAATKPVRASKESPKKKTSNVKTAPGVDVLVSLDSGREVLWRVTRSGLQEIPVTEVRKALSFTGADKHFKVPQAMRDGSASDFVLAEVGEPIRLINTSKTLGSLYSTTVSRVVQKAPMSIGPGLLVLEQLFQKDREADEPLLCGLVLQDASSGAGLVILYHVSSMGDISEVQVTANVDNVNFVLAQFAATNRVELATTKVVLFNNEDLLAGSSGALYFPLEQEYFGISLSKLTGYVALIALAGAVGGGSYALKNYTHLRYLQGMLANTQSEKLTAQKSLDTRLMGSVKSFSATQSVLVDQASKRAGLVWVEGSKVVMEATAKQETYVVTMPLTKAGLVSGNPAVLGQITKDTVSPLLQSAAIAGCTKSTPAISGGMNALQITITCENNLGLFSAYWPS